MKNTCIIVFFLAITFALNAHPIKMTTGKMEINTVDKTFLLTINFFIDDFESELRKMVPQDPFNYNLPGEVMKITIADYVTSNFDLKINDIPIQFRLKSIEQIDRNVCQVNFDGQFTTINILEFLTIRNTLLFSSFSKQSNILHLIIDNYPAKILQFFPAAPIRIEKFPFQGQLNK